MIYRDKLLNCIDDKIKVNSLIAPMLGDIEFELNEVIEIKKIKLSLFQKFRIGGSNDLKIWWPFDISRPSKKYGYIIKLFDFPVYIGLTVQYEERFENYLNAKIPERFHKSF